MQNDIFQSQSVAYQNSYLVKVYFWMTLALMITAATALLVFNTPGIRDTLFSSPVLFYGLMIGELILVFVLVGMINRMSSSAVTLVYILYSVLNGVTMSSIFIVYTAGSIASTFFITAGTFGIMSFYGYVTKSDLTKIGNVLLMALIGVIIASIVNIFVKSSTLYWIVSIAGVFIFVGLVAYDTQKLKRIAESGVDGEQGKKLSILGALTLYLDFINLFLFLLRIFGGRRE